MGELKHPLAALKYAESKAVVQRPRRVRMFGLFKKKSQPDGATKVQLVCTLLPSVASDQILVEHQYLSNFR